MGAKATLVVAAVLVFGIGMSASNVYGGGLTAAANFNVQGRAYDQNGTQLFAKSFSSTVLSLAVSRNGQYVAIGTSSSLSLYKRDGTLMWSKNIPVSYGGNWAGKESKSVAISTTAMYVAAACTDGLRVYKKDGTLHWSLLEGPETCVDFSSELPDGDFGLAFCDKASGIAHLYSTMGFHFWTFDLDAFWIATAMCGSYTVVGELGDEVHLYKSDGTNVWSYSHANWAGVDYIRVDMCDDATKIVAGNDDPGDATGTRFCYFSDGGNGWDAGDGTPIWCYTPSPDDPNYDTYSVAISPGGNYMAAGPIPDTKVFHRSSNVPIQSFAFGGLQSIALHSPEHGIAGNSAGSAYLFDPSAGTVYWTKSGTAPVNTVGIGWDTRVPALSPWGMIVLSMLLLTTAATLIIRRRLSSEGRH